MYLVLLELNILWMLTWNLRHHAFEVVAIRVVGVSLAA
jgi:hypothetical protein